MTLSPTANKKPIVWPSCCSGSIRCGLHWVYLMRHWDTTLTVKDLQLNVTDDRIILELMKAFLTSVLTCSISGGFVLFLIYMSFIWVISWPEMSHNQQTWKRDTEVWVSDTSSFFSARVSSVDLQVLLLVKCSILSFDVHLRQQALRFSRRCFLPLRNWRGFVFLSPPLHRFRHQWK